MGSKNFARLLKKRLGKKIDGVLVGPPFCISAKGHGSFDLSDPSLTFYCRVVPENRLTESERKNILGQEGKIIPSYLRNRKIRHVSKPTGQTEKQTK